MQTNNQAAELKKVLSRIGDQLDTTEELLGDGRYSTVLNELYILKQLSAQAISVWLEGTTNARR